MSSFSIVVDSNCDLPAEYIEDHGIDIIPMPFELDSVAHNEGYWQEISCKEFYSALRKGSVATTSQINPLTFIAVFTQYAREGRDALFLILSSGLSSTFNNAMFALQEVKEIYPDCGIYLIDTICATVGHGYLAMQAVKKRDEGLSVAETAAYLEEIKHKCIGMIIVNDLMYLHRGGRLSKLSAIAGSALGIKPIVAIRPDGTLSLKEKVRGKKPAMEMFVKRLQQCTNDKEVVDTVMISHTDCIDDAQFLTDMIKTSVNVREVVCVFVGPVIGAHIGPGSIVMLFEANMTRDEYESRFYK